MQILNRFEMAKDRKTEEKNIIEESHISIQFWFKKGFVLMNTFKLFLNVIVWQPYREKYIPMTFN